MAVMTKVRERYVACVDCESRIALNGAVKLGQELICPLCDAVMETSPSTTRTKKKRWTGSRAL